MYELVLPNGATESFTTLGDLLHRINRKTSDPDETLFGKADSMEVWTTSGKCYYVEQRYSKLGIRMSPDDGHVEEIITRMLDEVMPYARSETGAIKAPWQMTSAQWGAINAIGKVAYGVYPCLSEAHRQQTCLSREGHRCSVVEFVSSEFNARFGFDHNGPLYDGHQTNCRHEVHVAYALARGDNVSEEVMAEYNNAAWLDGLFDLHWFKTLLQKPYLRGRTTAEKLSNLVSLLKSDRHVDSEITEENWSYLVGLMNSLPPEATYVDYDDLLYSKGVLHVRPLPVPAKETDIGVPFNEFAAALRQMQVANRTKTQLAHIEQEMGKRHMTLREKAFQLKLVDDIPKWESHSWANRIAKAIEGKNLDYLLETLDGTSNDTTKQVVEKFYAVKLRNVSAAKRRRGVFTLAGFVTDAQFAASEAAYKAQKNALREAKAAEEDLKRMATRVEDAKSIAAQTNYNVNGVRMNGAEFVEKCIRDGYTRIVKRTRGAVPEYRLSNDETQRSYNLKRKSGTLGYAQALLEKEPA